ncbi:N-terminal phage integrase SAM-like domain-containing protein [Tuberibacillus sp. Marseille-P3662]|uniref:N-terminal phage integrase SAM-like domain-containing protein n=1 Tax=Tuberibacillus sp. Marseille-P3662 TaxID=1965358 RepID=UPI0020CB1DF4|nr:N-terminal phage integrase SAM-like domain-containing protein [Tuberibacillus sp. Marseille-P3662]
MFTIYRIIFYTDFPIHGFTENGDELINKFMYDWLETYKKPFLKPITYSVQERVVRLNINTRWGNYRLKDISRKEYQQWINELREHYSEGTTKRIHSIMSSALDDAVHEFSVLRESESNRGEEYNFYVGNHPLDNIPYIMSSTGFNIDVGGRFDITYGSVWTDGSYHGTSDTTFFTGENLVNLRTDKSGHGSGIYVDVDGSGPQIYSKDIYERTYSSSANMHITSYGTIGRATSATKYKLDIEEIETPDFAERILQLKPKSWYDKTATEQYLTTWIEKKKVRMWILIKLISLRSKNTMGWLQKT